MTKCLSCLVCGAVKSFNADGSTTMCECSPPLAFGWWHDQSIGFVKVHVADPSMRSEVQVLALHNGVLRAGHDLIPDTFRGPDGLPREFTPGEEDVVWQHVHSEARNAPQLPQFLQIFHSNRRGCWSVIQRPDTTPDTLWATPAEAEDRGLPVARTLATA